LRAVVLAAGDGGRLGAHTAAVPKPLVRLAGRPIVDYTLDALVAVGVTDVTVVVGYREAQVRAALAETAPDGLRIAYVTNPRFHAGASLSLRAARQAVKGEPFLLLMSDHILSEELLGALLAAHEAAPALSFVAADSAPHDAAYTHEATKLLTDGGAYARVLAIGKQLPQSTALDTGAFLLAADAWEAIDAAPEDCELSVVFGELIARGGLYAADVSGAFWYDIDTAEDLAAAAAILAPGAGIA
jgi:choline kinase